MNRRLLLATLVVITACSTNTREEKKVVDGQEFLCTWTEKSTNPFGVKSDYRCEPFFRTP